MRKRILIPVLILTALIFAVAVPIYLFVRGGLSARDEPSRIETVLARQMRRLAVPRADRDRLNPVRRSPGVLAESRAHFADHCAICHGNDGRGDTTIGRNLYPKAPDMRLEETQNLADGELFYIIHNGIRLTGMPAWGSGSPDRDLDSWKLVHFIRHLPRISEQELAEMRRLNPVSPHALEETRGTGRRAPAAPPDHVHQH